ncbi:MAG: alanine racemase [Chlamydiota bacterium]|nr:alanine racemase [Chlamydiota bacterium]
MPLAKSFVENSNTTHATSTSRLIIDLEKISDNIQTLYSHLPKETEIMAVIKANAYGTDAITMAHYLQTKGISFFGVAYIEEAIHLRKNGIDNPIFVTHVPHFQLHEAAKWNIDIAISDRQALNILSKNSKKQNVHINVNTGMSRFGCPPEEAVNLAKLIENTKGITLAGIMSHFHSSDTPSADKASIEQIKILDNTISEIEKLGIFIRWKHLPNTSAVARFHLPQYNIARIGQGIYGIHLNEECRTALPLKIALTLESPIIDIRSYPKGATIGYGQTYTVKSESKKIGVLPIGYHDGIHRSYSNKGVCRVNGKFAPFVGNICMDYLLIDLTETPNVAIGDYATLFGCDSINNIISPNTFATLGNTISHELISCIGKRVKRIFV